MKILKSLSSSFLFFFILLLFFFSFIKSFAEEEVIDIWNIEESKEIKKNEIEINSENVEPELNLKIDFEKLENNNLEIVEGSNLESNIILAGLYDPAENGLSIDMWKQTDGNDLNRIFKRLSKLNLSSDANEILKIALLTNSYVPKKNISEEEFIDIKIDYLINDNSLELIKSFLIKNQNVLNNSKLMKYYVETYLSNADLKNACEIFNKIDLINDIYLTKFKIYCLINEEKREEAQLQFDLVKENNFNDIFFENKFNYLMGYSTELQNEISEKNILEFHLSHRTTSDFKYKPSKKTTKIIWRYLSSANLFEKVDNIDLENQEEILLIEQAVHEKNYNEKDLLELYKRFKFNINQLINVHEAYKLLPPSQGRALLYQRLLLSNDTDQILNISSKLKNSFIEGNMGEAFSDELSKILEKIDENEISSNYSSFYNSNFKNKKVLKKNIKINNKVIHQSKLLNYFEEEYELRKIEKDTNDIIKKIKKNKEYFVSTKDLIILESLISDGVKILKKYENLFEFNQSEIPTDIQLLINNNEIGLVLLRLAEIVGEDNLKDLGPDTLYFIISTLNQLNIDPIRNTILLKVLPLKV
tara:strand:+ start:14802 stop:16565 length:1764 start_codon:yes stop_codon:yes gene_type:complete